MFKYIITVNDYQDFLDLQQTLYNAMKRYISVLEDIEKEALTQKDINALFELLMRAQKIAKMLRRMERAIYLLDKMFNQNAILN